MGPTMKLSTAWRLQNSQTGFNQVQEVCCLRMLSLWGIRPSWIYDVGFIMLQLISYRLPAARALSRRAKMSHDVLFLYLSHIR